jgi:archaellum biogenesis protein FlaJ (TadC family)
MLIYATVNEKDFSRLAQYFHTLYHLTHDWFVAADIPVHYADAIRYNVQRLPARFLPLLTRQGLC